MIIAMFVVVTVTALVVIPNGFDNAAIVRALLSYFAPDYRNLPLDVPAWAVEAVGTSYVEHLLAQ